MTSMILKTRATFLTVFFSLITPSLGFASPQIGTLTQIQGEVTLYSNPSKALHKEAAGQQRALFEGEYYLVSKAKIGDRVEQGNIVRTAPGAKVRVIYDNGDQFNVDSATSFRIFWNKDAADANTDMNLMYGKLRGVVAKGGPRSKLKIQTKAATMGVRGTDFFIATSPATNETEVAILRGEVELKPAAPEAKPVEVKTGFSAAVTAPAPQETKPDQAHVLPAKPLVAPIVELRKTTQEDLLGIQKSSKIAAKAPEKAELPKEVAQKIEKLEIQAVKTALEDVKHHDPKLYAKLEQQQIRSTDQIHSSTVETLLKTAPKAPAKRKPSITELENLEGGAYEKYFRNID